MATKKREIVVLAITGRRNQRVLGVVADGALERHDASLSVTRQSFHDEGFVKGPVSESPVSLEWLSMNLGVKIGRREVWVKYAD